MRRSQQKNVRQKFGLRFILPHQVRWLVSSETLRKQTGMSLVDRSKQCRKEFPGAEMNPTLLRKIYRLHGIQKKRYRWHKTPKVLEPDKAK